MALCGCTETTSAKPKAEKRGILSGSKGAPWTIECIELPGPTRLRDVQAFAESLKNTPGIRAADVFFADESDGFARLYYGRYVRNADKSGKRTMSPELRGDLDVIRQLAGPGGEHYFLRALPVPMPQPDVGKSEWKLQNAKGSYSLQVAVFEPTDEFWEFKKAAAEYCEYLRKKGHEAYYHHTRGSSVVTVGSFGEDALVRGKDDRPYFSAEVGRLQSDELLKYNVVNGAIHRVRDAKGNWVPITSRLVQIPREAHSQK